MYKALESWINIPYTFEKLSTYDVEGVKTYESAVASYCYPEGYSTVVEDLSGKSVLSKLRLFVDGQTNINKGARVTLHDEIYEVKAIAPFYRQGYKDLLEVYI
jgi:hypothetical protein